MTRDDLYKVAHKWVFEEREKRSAMIILAEDIDNKSAASSSSAMGEINLLANGLSKTIEQDKDFLLLIAMALSVVNDELFEKILNTVTEARKLDCRASDNNGL